MAYCYGNFAFYWSTCKGKYMLSNFSPLLQIVAHFHTYNCCWSRYELVWKIFNVLFQEIIHRTPVCLDLFCFKVPCYHFILFNGIFSLLLIVVTHCYYFKVCKESSKCFEYRNWSRLRINKFASLEYCFVVFLFHYFQA